MNLRDGSGSTIVVTGGTYTEYFPNTEQPWEVTVPDGYTVIDNQNGTWSVVPDSVAMIVETGVKYPSIRDAVEAAENGQTIRVLKDHEMDVSELTQNAVVFIDGTKTQKLTIDFNGKNVTANTGNNTSGNVWTIFYARYGAEVTVTGDGNVTIFGDDLNRPYMFWASASTITMEKGTYIMDGTPTQGADKGAVSHTFYASSGGHIYIKNGFYSNINSKIDLMNLRDGSGSSIVVTGGTYTEYFPNTDQPLEVTVPDGYTVIDNLNSTWSVVPASQDEEGETEEIEDEDAPLGSSPSEPEEEVEEEDVPQGSSPAASGEVIENESYGSAPSSSTSVPKAGDNSVFRSMIIGTLALVAMAVLVLNKKKYFID